MPEKPRALVLASGRSAGMYDYGALIDSFDIVVRFQGFETFTGAEHQVGTKADVCVINGSLEALRDVDVTLSILGPRGTRFLWTPSFPVPDRQAVLDEAMARHGTTYQLFPFEKVRMLREKLLNDEAYPSSGLVAVVHFLGLFGRVALHGFDMLDPGITEFVVTHYFDSKAYPVNHSYRAEADFFRAMIEGGAIIPLHALASEVAAPRSAQARELDRSE